MLLSAFKKYIWSAPNLSFLRRRIFLKKQFSNKAQPEITQFDDKLIELLEKYEEKIIYNTVLQQQREKLGIKYRKRISIVETMQSQVNAVNEVSDIALSLKYLSEDLDVSAAYKNEEKRPLREKYRKTHFPFRDGITVTESNEESSGVDSNDDVADDLFRDVRARYDTYTKTSCKNWMSDYENFDDNSNDEFNHNWKINYGSPDPKTPISNVPCGGCGALLHCQDTSIPGYIPSEIFKNCNMPGGVNLKGIICQRCHFLKHYNLALQARVSSEDYPKILQTVSKKLSIVILVVDLLDFPCSIWPGIADMFWKTPMVVVGNKIDLLPQDSKNFLDHVKSVLRENIILSGFGSSYIQAVEVISAKTGFGVENLITQLHQMWKFRGNFYIIGCTNVGKSSLFNILLQSDFCTVQASDLMQRATTSIWPGTTLNLLKFPVMPPSGYLQYLRLKRLEAEKEIWKQQKELRKDQLKATRNPEYATLIGHLGQTFMNVQQPNESPFTTNNENAVGKTIIGINEDDRIYKHGRWCFDTPGVVQSDQILHLLTTEELTQTLPKRIIEPKTFSLYEKTSLFIAGLARLDYIKGPDNIKITVFCSENLPITICKTESAEEIYNAFLGSELFRIPTGQKIRLKKWPALIASKDLCVKGVDSRTASADIVLSSSGWVTVTGNNKNTYIFKGWTPEGRGVFLRSPLLPKIVNFRGKKVKGSPAFVKSRIFIQ